MNKPILTRDDLGEIRSIVHEALYELEEIKTICKMYGYTGDVPVSRWIRTNLNGYKDLQEATNPSTQSKFMKELTDIINRTGNTFHPTDLKAILNTVEDLVKSYTSVKSLIVTVSPSTWRKMFEDME